MLLFNLCSLNVCSAMARKPGTWYSNGSYCWKKCPAYYSHFFTSMVILLLQFCADEVDMSNTKGSIRIKFEQKVAEFTLGAGAEQLLLFLFV